MEEARLREACITGNYKAATQALVSGATNVNSALFLASTYGHHELVLLMLYSGATNINDSFLNACSAGQYEVVRILVQFGAKDFAAGIRIANLALSSPMQARGAHQIIAHLYSIIQCDMKALNDVFLSAITAGQYDTVIDFVKRGATAFKEGRNLAQNLLKDENRADLGAKIIAYLDDVIAHRRENLRMIDYGELPRSDRANGELPRSGRGFAELPRSGRGFAELPRSGRGFAELNPYPDSRMPVSYHAKLETPLANLGKDALTLADEKLDTPTYQQIIMANNALLFACQYEDIRAIDAAITNGAENLSEALEVAQKNGKEENAKYLISCGAKSLSELQLAAMEHQSLEMVQIPPELLAPSKIYSPPQETIATLDDVPQCAAAAACANNTQVESALFSQIDEITERVKQQARQCSDANELRKRMAEITTQIPSSSTENVAASPSRFRELCENQQKPLWDRFVDARKRARGATTGAITCAAAEPRVAIENRALPRIASVAQEQLPSPDQLLLISCITGNIGNINTAIVGGAKAIEEGFYRACEAGQLAAVNEMLSFGAKDWKKGLLIAVKNGFVAIADLLSNVEHGNLNEALYIARMSNFQEMADMLSAKLAAKENRAPSGMAVSEAPQIATSEAPQMNLPESSRAFV
ncbi:MAG: ankyrin repeat domain-containing protein [Methylomonas sp.]|jgi:ankyrin repeat protein|uniref:hypothetical protein n=1 Tax=Methylomonas sp. TaxID=418 RepID=UPI0025E3E659|nr:hypothetical protein [Methylomonas sp.]MCK9608498.1 ankyrin repeat domain-containing protein [Methylomonas sp.]